MLQKKYQGSKMKISKRQLKRIIRETLEGMPSGDTTIEIDPDTFGFENTREVIETLPQYEDEGYYITGKMIGPVARLTSDLGTLWYWWQNEMGVGPDQRDEMEGLIIRTENPKGIDALEMEWRRSNMTKSGYPKKRGKKKSLKGQSPLSQDETFALAFRHASPNLRVWGQMYPEDPDYMAGWQARIDGPATLRYLDPELYKKLEKQGFWDQYYRGY